VRLKLKRREMVLLGLLAAAAVIVVWQPFNQRGTAPATLSRSPREAPLDPVPRIDLARLEERPTDIEIGRRDLFTYGAPRREAEAPEPVEATPPPAPRTAEPPAADPSGSLASRSGTSLPPMNLKFIGAVGNEAGVKVAVLVTERNEVLTGQPGEVIANRYRIEHIGIESVDLEDVSSGQSRRIPLKGN
jgi:hypothetical protein